MTIPRHCCAPVPTSRTISLCDKRPLTARCHCSHSGNACHALPRATSTAAPPLGSHKRTKAKSRCNEVTSTSASPVTMAAGSLPTHAAGTTDSATRSLSALRNRRASASGPVGIGSRSPRSCGLASLPDFEQELVRRNKERILLQHLADDHDRVSPHNVHYYAGTELRQIVGADDRVGVLGKHVIEACLVFHQVIYAWFVEQRPFHMGDQPGERIAGSRPRLDHLFEQGQHRVLIEAITAQVSVLPAPQLELAPTHRLLHVDAGFGEPPQVFSLQLGVDDVEGFVSPVKALFDERAKHPVLVVEAVEESANVTVLAETAPGTLHRTAVCFHVSPPAATGTCQSRADASEQIILLKGFAQVTNDAGSQRALPNAIVRIRRDQDGRNGLSGSRQALIQLESGHPRHLHVGDQARSAADMA